MSPPTNQDHVWQNRAKMELASVTSFGRIVTYAEMADAADIPAPQRIHKLTLRLETALRQGSRHRDRCHRAANKKGRNNAGLIVARINL